MNANERKQAAYDIKTDVMIIQRYLDTADRAPITADKYGHIMRRLSQIVSMAREMAE